MSEILRDEALEGLKGYMRDLMEAKYATNKREPLAQTLNRSYKWPTETKKDGFSFGIPSIPSKNSKQ